MIIGTTLAISKLFSPTGIQIVNPRTRRFSERKKIIFGNIINNIIHLIINHNLILIHRIINHDMLITTNINSIAMIEKHNYILT